MAEKRWVVIGLTLFAGALSAFLVLSASAEEYRTEDEEARAYNVTRVVKTVDGLSFLVQEDRPIEKVAGTYRPVDMDSYVALKFNKMEKKLQEVASTLSKKIEALERRVQALEAKNKVLSTPGAVPATPAADASGEPLAKEEPPINSP